MVKGFIFVILKVEFEFNFVFCIDIIYRDEYDFENCEINDKVVRNLILLFKRKWKKIKFMKIEMMELWSFVYLKEFVIIIFFKDGV